MYRTIYSKHYRSALGAVALDPNTEALPLPRTYTQYPAFSKMGPHSTIDGVVAVVFMCLDGQGGEYPWRWVEDRGGDSNLYLPITAVGGGQEAKFPRSLLHCLIQTICGVGSTGAASWFSADPPS